MADADGLPPLDLAAELSPGSPAAGPADLLGAALAAVRAVGVGDAGLAGVEAAGAEGAGGPTAAVEPAGDDAADAAAEETELAEEAEPGTEGLADLFVDVQPAVTRAGTSTSAAAIRRIPPSSLILRGSGPV